MPNLKAFLLAAALIITMQYAQAAWTNPSSTAPNNNTDTPVNIGGTLQQKLGSLAVNTAVPGNTVGLTVFGESNLGHSGTVPANLNTDIGGNIGADEYCDQTGANCISAATLVALNNKITDLQNQITTLKQGGGGTVTSFQNAPNQGAVAGTNYGAYAYWCPSGSYVDGMFYIAENGYIVPTGLQCEHIQSK